MCRRPFSLFILLIAIGLIPAAGTVALADPGDGTDPAVETEQLALFYIDAFNTRDMDVMREVFADQLLVKGEAYDQAAYVESVQMYFILSSGITMEPTFIVAADEHVTLRLEFSGTRQGDFLGQDISGQEYEVSEIIVFRVADGRFAEQWYEWDELGFLTQLGILESSYGQ